MLKELSEELISGGYEQDTPAAIVYKASWPEEKVLNCTVKTLAQTAKEAGVTKTALIVVGRVLEESMNGQNYMIRHLQQNFGKHLLMLERQKGEY